MIKTAVRKYSLPIALLYSGSIAAAGLIWGVKVLFIIIVGGALMALLTVAIWALLDIWTSR